jgi:hypothetical protein
VIENDSSFPSAAEMIDSPDEVITAPEALSPTESGTAARSRFSFMRLAVIFVAIATGWSSGYMMAPQQAILMEPQDEDLVVLNGCVISACSYLASVRAQHRLESSFWSRVMLVRYQGNTAGHAYCVWQTDGHMFGYDRAGGTFPIPSGQRDPKAIAESLAAGLERVLKKPMTVARAEFIEPKNARLYTY